MFPFEYLQRIGITQQTAQTEFIISQQYIEFNNNSK